MKTAILVIGCSEKDTLETARRIQIEQEEKTKEVWHIISERQVLEDYIKEFDYNALCMNSWFEPIKNPVIINLLNESERVIENGYVGGVIICGQFAIDENVRKAYMEILEEQGYAIEIHPVMTSWVSLLSECLFRGTPIKRALEYWTKFTKQITRQYAPLEPYQSKAVIVSPEIATLKDNIPGSYELLTMLEALQDRGYSIIVIDRVDTVNRTQEAFKIAGITAQLFSRKSLAKKLNDVYKPEIFWDLIANYYDIRLVIEHDASCIPKWREIGLPLISLTNIFDVEYLK